MSDGTGKVRLALVDASNRSGTNLINKNYSCKSKCYSCCFRMVQLTVVEAMVIYSHLVETNQWQHVQKILKEQIKLSKNTDPTSWFKMRIECPVLDTKTKLCRAYKVRPVFCSTHFVKSDAEACDPWYTGSVDYDPEYMKELYELTMKRIRESVSGSGILGITLPIQSALLLSEKISIQSGLDFDQIMKIISNEF